ncbi:hypothetical protein RW1_051_00560 [Rhodococcus wratislaviensis NBRC 100605]|uniref:AAA+ ATPase domain-containing protein n=2 Tax=Rhodococcus wratislaviensis TaxID=44752 RepID=X0Q9M5_RHOWR|nr:hypothetical protein RW1_051_00560 [Rhodococcus wratislaviensis NBRC 100605]
MPELVGLRGMMAIMTATDMDKARAGLDELEALGRRVVMDGYLRRDSVLTPGKAVWSGDNFAELERVYVTGKDASKGPGFFEKLTGQLDSVDDSAVQLFAELLLLQMAPLSNVLGRTKLNYLQQVLKMMDAPVEVPDDIVHVLSTGAFNGGTGFNTMRPAQLRLLILFGVHLNTLSEDERLALGEDPVAFRAALAHAQSNSGENQPAQRAALQYLAFPKFFLPIVNVRDRRLIRDAFSSYLGRPVSDDVDVDLNEINSAFEEEQGGRIEYYHEPWKSMWKPAAKVLPVVEDDATEVLEEDAVDPTALSDPDQALADDLHVDLDWLVKCVDLLRDRPQLIFYGPPGTGKTFIAKSIAKHLVGEDHPDNVKIVQFHPAYSYEDFFEGFRPSQQAGGQIGFELKPGPLRQLTDRARRHPDELFVLVIDEINRGNLAKIFGELYFLLEYRDEAIDLMYSAQDAEPFTMPRNILIVGTMNTADRSIALVDTAMRRRFAFVPLHPAKEPTKSLLRRWLAARRYPTRVADLHDALNAAIGDPDFQIGPSYFMRPAVHSEGGLAQVWDTAILPLLEEYHFGDHSVDINARYGFDTLIKDLPAGE